MNVDEKFELIKRNTAEIITEKELKDLLVKKTKPVIYWGTAPTGKPSIAYLFPALKIADFLRAGFHVKILIADLHAALDNVPWNILEKRYDYYSKIIPLLIKSIGVDVSELEIVKGSEMELKPEYMYDVLQMSSNVSVHDATKAASDVVKMGDNPKLSGIIYPLMQAMDEEYLKVDCQLGGTDQRKIMVLARENLPKIGYNSRIEIMNPLIPGLVGKKNNTQGKITLNVGGEEEFDTFIIRLKKVDNKLLRQKSGILNIANVLYGSSYEDIPIYLEILDKQRNLLQNFPLLKGESSSVDKVKGLGIKCLDIDTSSNMDNVTLGISYESFNKMSSSDVKSKIDFLDDEKTIMQKVNAADCVEGNPDNGVMAFLKYVVMTIKGDKKEKFVVKRDKKFGGDVSYNNYEEIEKDFIEKKLHPMDLKIAVAKEIVEILKPVQKEKKVLEKLMKEAYE
jgi:tyrosyl-tRNA synthetase